MVVILFIDDCPEYYQVEIDLSDFFLLLFLNIFFNSLSFFWCLAIVEKSCGKIILVSNTLFLLLRKHSCMLSKLLAGVSRRDRASPASLFTPDRKMIWAPHASITKRWCRIRSLEKSVLS